MPQRIQRTRKKGYRTPLGSRYVGRPTRWGNPFKPAGAGSDIILGDASHRRGKLLSPWIHIETCHPDNIRSRCVELYRLWLSGENPWYIVPCELSPDNIMLELQGLDLSCWCPAGSCCHADVLIEIANKI